jgi:glutaredoxin-related protein
MKIIMYGTEICPDCVEAKKQLMNSTDIELDYRNITEKTATLKEFLSYRDHEKVFEPIIERGSIGIPFFILEDGTKTFEISDFIDLKDIDSVPNVNFCSIDGKGHC